MWCFFYYLLIFLFLLKFFTLATNAYNQSNVCLVGKTAIITGGNGGMGYMIALNLASRGCRVIIADIADATETVQKIIAATGNSNVTYVHLNLASLSSVRKFASHILGTEKRLDILINNAGCIYANSYTDDGIYSGLQINHLGHFLLTHLLLSLLKEAKNARVVFVSSLLAFTHDLDDGTDLNRPTQIGLDLLKPIFDYGNAKICMIAATKIFARKLEKYGITVVATYPGIVNSGFVSFAYRQLGTKHLGIVASKLFIYFAFLLYAKSPFEGMQCTLHAALSNEVESGSFLVECRNFLKPPKISNETFCTNVWNESIRLVKMTKEEEIS